GAQALRDPGARGVRARATAVDFRVAVVVPALPAARAAARRAPRADGPAPQRRAHAERRPRAHRDAAAGVLRPAGRGDRQQLMRVAVRPLTLRFREPQRTAFGELRERELLVLELEGRDGVSGRGEAAPLEPYDG